MSDPTDSVEPVLRPDGAPRFLYVDEAGDPVLFGRRGRPHVGNEGCSTFFILGKLDVPDPERLAAALTNLRADLMSDPTLRALPSMSPTGRRPKTAAIFHAKDDVPEVRREVFKLLMTFPLQFHAVVRDKRAVLAEVQRRNKANVNFRYRPNDLYDQCVPDLLMGRLHKQRAYRVVFATRGSKPRTEAFEEGVLKAKQAFQRQHGIESVAPVEVVASDPRRVVCLQAADYFLWALQRAFERGEHRYLDVLWPKVSGVWDRDATNVSGSTEGQGVWYTAKKPIAEGFRE